MYPLQHQPQSAGAYSHYPNVPVYYTGGGYQAQNYARPSNDTMQSNSRKERRRLELDIGQNELPQYRSRSAMDQRPPDAADRAMSTRHRRESAISNLSSGQYSAGREEYRNQQRLKHSHYRHPHESQFREELRFGGRPSSVASTLAAARREVSIPRMLHKPTQFPKTGSVYHGGYAPKLAEDAPTATEEGQSRKDQFWKKYAGLRTKTVNESQEKRASREIKQQRAMSNLANIRKFGAAFNRVSAIPSTPKSIDDSSVAKDLASPTDNMNPFLRDQKKSSLARPRPLARLDSLDDLPEIGQDQEQVVTKVLPVALSPKRTNFSQFGSEADIDRFRRDAEVNIAELPTPTEMPKFGKPMTDRPSTVKKYTKKKRYPRTDR